MSVPLGVSVLCHGRGGALMGAPNAGNYPTPFVRMPSWFYNGLGAIANQLVSRAFTEVFWFIYCCHLNISVERKMACRFLVCHLTEVIIFFSILNLEQIFSCSHLLSQNDSHHSLITPFSMPQLSSSILHFFTFKNNFVFILLYFLVHPNSHY